MRRHGAYAGGVTQLIPLSLLAAQLAFFTGAAPEPAPGRSDFRVALREDDGLLDITYRDRRLMRYAFATNQFKPYVRELFTLEGENLLLDAPADHLHHHGLMYAIRVNGANFWEEAVKPGYQKTVELSSPAVTRSAAGLPQVSFTHLIHWIPFENRAAPTTASCALLIERRTLTLSVNEAEKEVSLQWSAHFQVGPGADKVVLDGAAYHGLGLRLSRSFDRDAVHFNAENAPYPTQGTGDVVAARWAAVSHQLGGHDVTVALFGQAAPSEKPSFFFSMVRPFAYLSATQGLDKAPLHYSAGDQFSVRYLLAVYSDRKTPQFLHQRHQLWR